MAHKYINPYGDELVITESKLDPGPVTHVIEILMSDGTQVKYIIRRKDLLHMLDRNLLTNPERL